MAYGDITGRGITNLLYLETSIFFPGGPDENIELIFPAPGNESFNFVNTGTTAIFDNEEYYLYQFVEPNAAKNVLGIGQSSYTYSSDISLASGGGFF